MSFLNKWSKITMLEGYKTKCKATADPFKAYLLFCYIASNILLISHFYRGTFTFFYISSHFEYFRHL